MEQREVSGDVVMTRIGQAIMLLHAGDREEARNRLGIIWSEIGERGAALHRCTLAHYMADAQDDPGDELAWDLRALTAAEGLTGAADTDPAAEHRDAIAVRAFVPSLHLSLAADYLKLQRFGCARIHLDRAWDAAGVLEDDEDDNGYGGGIRAAIGSLERRMRGRATGE
uniref:Tetratricopeptide repeat protein n=1 Tax=Streptomyces sp. NBC_01401 TaxID=2903854 RepID=A0AAU3H7L5_9ACTN